MSQYFDLLAGAGRFLETSRCITSFLFFLVFQINLIIDVAVFIHTAVVLFALVLVTIYVPIVCVLVFLILVVVFIADFIRAVIVSLVLVLMLFSVVVFFIACVLIVFVLVGVVIVVVQVYLLLESNQAFDPFVWIINLLNGLQDEVIQFSVAVHAKRSFGLAKHFYTSLR